MFNPYKAIRDVGISAVESPAEKRNLRLMNIMNLCLLLVLVGLVIGVLTYFDKPKMIPMVSIGITASVLYYVILKIAPIWLTKVYFCLLPTVFVSFFAVLAVGAGGADKYYLVICAILPLLLFNKKINYIGMVLLSTIAFFIVHYMQQEYPPMFPLEGQQLKEYSLFNFAMLFGLTYLFIKLFKTELIGYQEEIEKQKYIVEEKQKEIVDSITYAKRIQEAILPPDQSIKEVIEDGFILYQPKDIVAGDFYWTEKRNGMQMFAAADCTGHGVPGAMVSVVCSNAINRAVNEFELTDPGQILDKTKQLVLQTFEKSVEEVKDGMDIALCCWDAQKRVLHYAGANNPLWIIRKGLNEVETVKANRQAIGKDLSTENFKSHPIQMFEGDSIYIFSDGFHDQFGGEKGKKYKTAKLKKYLLSIVDLPLVEQHESLRIEFEEWRGDLEQIDDVCVIGVRL